MVQIVQRPFSNYTAAALVDVLIFYLLSKNDCEILKDEIGHDQILVYNPYLNQAEGLLYKINLYDPLPEFVIWESDIPYDLALELSRLGHVTMKRVITDAVRRIYESVDPEYYHTNGIHGKVKWRFGEG
jgi:hypothetical protein